MKCLLVFAACIAAVTAAHIWKHHHTPQARTALPEGYYIKPMIWRGTVKEGDPEMTLHGTIEDVATQIRAIGPQFIWPSQDQHPAISKRAETTNVTCDLDGVNAYGAPLSHVCQIRDNLVHAPGTCSVEGSSSMCSRISCSGHAALWLCNDSPPCTHTKCSDLVAYVDDIVNECQRSSVGHMYDQHAILRGQGSNTDDYHVIIGYDDC
ncbi:hypothetical protein K449DRAFT_451344 [Hypoxylon sp. EC38]|nr:hypothetical protein K449DRAFT_451344 [Hypoxylon sp. EC38]